MSIKIRRMFEGRRSASMQVLLLSLLLLHSYDLQEAEAAYYQVGGATGWTFNTVSWPAGKRFLAGDTLVFNYNPAFHNVVKVNRGGYQYCTAPIGSQVYTSGRDAIKLVKGQNFFICSVFGHCQLGMKIAVNAA